MPQFISGEEGLSTPSAYATPEQIQAARQYAQALLQKSGDNEPISHPLAGVNKMVQALVGGYGLSSAAALERQGKEQMGSEVINNPFGPHAGAQPPAAPSAPAPSAPGQAPSTAAAVRYNNPGAQNIGPTATAYGATGSQTIAGGNHIAVFHDPVDGGAALYSLLNKGYVGMPLTNAIAKWSTKDGVPTPQSMQYAATVAHAAGVAPNTVITPDFLKSPQGLALGKAMANWEAGGKYPMTDQQWAASHAKAFGSPQGGQPLAFSGEPANQGGGQPSASAGTSALAKGGPGGQPPIPGGPVTRADPSAAASAFPPGTTPFRPQISPRLMGQAVANPSYLSPEMRQFIEQSYVQQGQPVQMQGPFGGTYSLPASGQGQPAYIPKGTMIPYKAGGVETEVPTVIGPGGPSGEFTARPVPESGGAPAKPAKRQYIDDPSLPRFSPPPGEADVGSGVSKYAAEEPTSKIDTAGLPPEITKGQSEPKTMLGTAPPEAGQKVAQLDPNVEHRMRSMGQLGADVGAMGERAKKDVDLYTKNADQYSQNGINASENLPEMQYARQLIEDPRFKQGIFANPLTQVSRVIAALGGEDTAKYNQTFEKLIQGGMLKSLRSLFQGTGQVRAAELVMLDKANATPRNTLGANRAVLNVTIKSMERAADIGKIADAYRNGMRQDKNGWYKSDQAPTNDGMQTYVRHYLKDHPIFTDAEIQDYGKQFEADPKYPAQKAEGGGSRPVKAAAGAPPAAPTGSGLSELEAELGRRGVTIPK